MNGVLRGVDTQTLSLVPVGAGGGNPIDTFLGLDPGEEIFKPADCRPRKGKGGGKGKKN